MLEQTENKSMGIDLATAKQYIKMKNDVLTLVAFPAFQSIVEKSYFTNEALRLVSLLGDPHMQEEEQQKGTLADMRAISSFQFYLKEILRIGNAAESSLKSYEKEQELMLKEEEEGVYEDV